MDFSTPRTFLVTGGAGFIGSALVRHLIAETPHTVVNADKLTYAGHRASLAPISGAARHHFEQIDICDAEAVARLFQQYEPDAVLHLAAESHVDRSIDGPAAFVETNITGTYTLLEAARRFLEARPEEVRSSFRFLHVSTDEVYGSLGETGLFTEETPYDPSSPYSGSKAAADHLARAWQRTYGLPVLVTNCSNNYGPYQFPEKLIPLMTLKAAAGEPLPVYGDGQNVRDWLYVEDHVAALLAVLARGTVGETYNIGGRAEQTNLEVVRSICAVLDEVAPHPDVPDRAALITFVEDRPGHDRRYAIDASKAERALGWAPQEHFESGLRKTVRWYLAHTDWCAAVSDNRYDLGRLGART